MNNRELGLTQFTDVVELRDPEAMKSFRHTGIFGTQGRTLEADLVARGLLS
jgi:hypothetical protein